MTKATKYPEFGSVSSGTMRADDLLGPFANLLEDLDAEKVYAKLVSEAYAAHENDAVTPDEDKDEIVSDLFDALSDFSPPYGYFGAHEGDGADYGFWPSHDSIEDACRDGSALKVSDLSEVPARYSGDVFLVTDHGNLSYYSAKRGKCREVWAIV